MVAPTAALHFWPPGTGMVANREAKRYAGKVVRLLRRAYPDATCSLDFTTPLELLVATILSAQCTDKQVNRVTAALFKKFSTPRDFAEASLKQIETLIRPTGFYRNKARNIKNCAAVLLNHYSSRVPDSLADLVKLPGVGRKTANVVLGAAFGIPGVVVDTHVARISRRLGLTENTDPVKIEFDLMKILPNSDWSDFTLRLIYFGREYCTARRPKCPVCPLHKVCPWPDKTNASPETT
jgi:endonuclease-3